ncbi:uncharacterized protein AMSG_00400 [Thecamonas trahens ATCC 50062]|uniref:Transmembrane protein n=1 Tax=Thecamonas trahens ATCC 50062 TaxID=461836 RepID=A0A0L0DBF4_THETB|nr:hypothetical protein AMSG_00400 [Thecamonas trahens ATCC 50062]KNC48623.1 hypothetical protein AMSG_00400 [Thecamonas trahens ATCC 50062]|eukprot:XP_013762679.1 hypothetical protein AMSG_00400 [Thecamonas trahens ATCC 50062]
MQGIMGLDMEQMLVAVGPAQVAWAETVEVVAGMTWSDVLWACAYVGHCIFTCTRVHRAEVALPARTRVWAYLLAVVACSAGSTVAALASITPTASLSYLTQPHAMLVPIVLWALTYETPLLLRAYGWWPVRLAVVIGQCAYKARGAIAFQDKLYATLTSDPSSMPAYARPIPSVWYAPGVIMPCVAMAVATGLTMRAVAYVASVSHNVRLPGRAVMGSRSMYSSMVGLAVAYALRRWTQAPVEAVRLLAGLVFAEQVARAEGVWSGAIPPPAPPLEVRSGSPPSAALVDARERRRSRTRARTQRSAAKSTATASGDAARSLRPRTRRSKTKAA